MNNDEITSYSKFRALTGITGIILPIAAVLGCFIKGTQEASLKLSISHYYFSKMHIVYTGVLCVLGGFLITCQGRRGLIQIHYNISQLKDQKMGTFRQDIFKILYPVPGFC